MAVLILHGIGGHAGIHWQQWLHDRLVEIGDTVVMPSLPPSGHPDRKEWLKAVQSLTENLNLQDLVIVTHSLGAATALDFLEISKSPIRAFVSVAGFGDDYGSELNSYFMAEKEIDFAKVRANIGKAYVIYADDDPYVPQKSLKLFADNLEVEPIIISSGGHLNTESGHTELPLLVDIFKNLRDR